MSKFKVRRRASPGGSHVYCRVFVRPTEGATSAFCGMFTVRAAEFPDLVAAMPGVAFEDERAPERGD